jgi:hypothetical protein
VCSFRLFLILYPFNPTSQSAPDGLSLIFHGSSYPSAPNAAQQSLNLTLLCKSDTNEPTFTSYNGSVLNVEWGGPAGCGTKSDDVPSGGDDKEEGGEKKESVGSGIGWFFLVYVPF